MKTVMDRASQPTPKFFQVLRTVGISLAAVSAAILATPIALPAILVKVAGYMAVAGAVAGAVSQTAVVNEEE